MPRKERKKIFRQKTKEKRRKRNWKATFPRARAESRKSVGEGKKMKTKTLETESNESLTVTSAINKQINKFMTPPIPLLTWKDMPEHLQFNPYVRTGESEDASFYCVECNSDGSPHPQAIDRSKMSKDASTVSSTCTTRPLTSWLTVSAFDIHRVVRCWLSKNGTLCSITTPKMQPDKRTLIAMRKFISSLEYLMHSYTTRHDLHAR